MRPCHAFIIGSSVLLSLTQVVSAQVTSFDIGATVRDFRMRDTEGGHPDFEWQINGWTTGMLASTLPASRVPTYIGTNGYGAVTSAETFDQWYRDVAGVNVNIPFIITMTQVGSIYRYQNNDFFPIDDQGFGNQGQAHNYSFTMYVPATFQYQAGANQTLTYAGDDDLWMFINNQLVIDIGGVHGSISQSINMDTLAASLGLTDGATVPMDIFFAERHTTGSNILIETSFVIVPVPGTAAALAFAAAATLRRQRSR